MFRKLHEIGADCVTIMIDGVPAKAESGESVAAVVLRTEDGWTRQSPVGGGKRAPYCMMGVCFECLAEVDGVSSVQTCLCVVSDQMSVVRQSGKRRGIC